MTNLDWWLQQLSGWGYIGIWFFMMLESVIFIIPSEVLMAAVGYLVYHGYFNLWLSISISAFGNITGSTILYLLAMRSEPYARRFVLRFVSERNLNKAYEMFRKRGKISIFLSQFIPGIRTLISIPSGVVRFNYGIFIISTYSGAFLWNLIWIGSVYKLGGQVDRLIEVFELYKTVILVSLVVLAVAGLIFIRRFFNRKGMAEMED